MTTRIVGRMVWKEYRVLRGFWLVLVLLAVLMQAVVVYAARPGAPPDGALYAFGALMVALFALGSGAAAFAGERADGTDQFLAGLPARPRQFFVGKVLFGVAGTTSLAVATLAITWLAFAKGPPTLADSLMIAQTFGMAAIEALVWGLLCSLLVRRPLLAALLAGAGVMLGIGAAGAIVDSGEQTNLLTNQRGESEVAPGLMALRGLIAGVVFAAAVALGLKWPAGPQLPALLRRARPRARAVSVVTPGRAGAARGPRNFARLVWQGWRQSRSTFGAIIGAEIVLLVATSPSEVWSEGWLRDCAVWCTLFAALLGACVFLGDQSQQAYRFFAERRASARAVWLARQFVGIAALVLLVGAALSTWALLSGAKASILFAPLKMGREMAGGAALFGNLQQLPVALLIALLAALAYAVGQLCSLVIKSGIMAGFVSPILTGLPAAWMVLVYLLGVNWFVGVAPLPAALLWATWLRAPGWILERNGWRDWARVALSVAVPAAAIWGGVNAYRVVQVPRVDPGFSPREYIASVTPADLETGEMYRRAADRLVPFKSIPQPNLKGLQGLGTPAEDRVAPGWWGRMRPTRRERAWLAANGEALAMTLAATERPGCAMQRPGETPNLSRRVRYLEHLLVTSALEAETQGRLDEALDRYLAALQFGTHLGGPPYPSRDVLRHLRHWAARSGQTPARIRAALAMIHEWQRMLPTISQTIEAEYVLKDRLISGGAEALAATEQVRFDWETLPQGKWNVPSLAALVRLMPSEQPRAHRVLNLLTSQELRLAAKVAGRLSTNEPTAELLWTAFAAEPFVETTPLLSTMGVYIRSAAFIRILGDAETQATKVILALVAWRIEHGTLPESLDVLVGPYFDELPLDPYTGRAFRYFPHGLPLESSSEPDVVERRKLGPCLWSSGPWLLSAGGEWQYYQHRTSAPPKILSGPREVLRQGSVYPIPPPN